ncbi:MAG: extracellular solute-binding protein [Acetivibrio sp.]
MRSHNYKMKWIILAILMVCTGCHSLEESQEKETPVENKPVLTMEEASKEDYGRYPEEITYTLGKMTAENNSNMPDGDTYENNVYTRYLKDMLNIQNVNAFEAAGNLYDNVVSMAVTDNELPDIMIVQDLDTLMELEKKNKIEDLSLSYQECASPKIKEIYDSYDGAVLDRATIDGKLMAIPGTNIQNGPNLLWLRKDWMDKLGLKAPTNLKEAEKIIQEFVEKDPGQNGRGQTVGLVFDAANIGNPDKCYQLDPLFSYFGAYPQKWLKNEDGTITYGSTTKEAKEALKHLQKLYKKNILDSQFLVRTSANIDQLIESGKCGSFFGPWWAPNNPIMNAYQIDRSADWQPYLIPTEEDGSITTYRQDASNKYIVVKKGFEHPEIAIKIINVLFDYTRYVDIQNQDMQNYYSLNVDPTARPLAVNVDYSDALARTTESIERALKGEKKEEELITIEKSYYKICKSYLSHRENPSPEEWAAYTSRITTVDMLSKAKVNYKETVIKSETRTMQKEGWNLNLMEKNAYLKIISGEADIKEFDSFVKEWKKQGGNQIERELAN